MQITPIEYGHFYHIYNRGINGESIFKNEENYSYFLKLYSKYLDSVVGTFAYCLMKNHFHFFVRIKEKHEIRCTKENPSRVLNPGRVISDQKPLSPSQQFSNLFNSYAQSINKANNRTGSLFEKPFKRKRIESDQYYCQLVYYIHLNPVRHKIVTDFLNYPYSSFKSFLSNQITNLKREKILNWFGGKDNFLNYHNKQQDLTKIKMLIEENLG